MGRAKRTKEYKKNRLKEAKELIKSNFGPGIFGLMKKKYALYRGKSLNQSEVYKFLFDRGFSYREIGALVGKTHESIRHSLKTYGQQEVIADNFLYKAKISSKPVEKKIKNIQDEWEIPVKIFEKEKNLNKNNAAAEAETRFRIDEAIEDEIGEREREKVKREDLNVFGKIFPGLWMVPDWVTIEEEEEPMEKMENACPSGRRGKWKIDESKPETSEPARPQTDDVSLAGDESPPPERKSFRAGFGRVTSKEEEQDWEPKLYGIGNNQENGKSKIESEIVSQESDSPNTYSINKFGAKEPEPSMGNQTNNSTLKLVKKPSLESNIGNTIIKQTLEVNKQDSKPVTSKPTTSKEKERKQQDRIPESSKLVTGELATNKYENLDENLKPEKNELETKFDFSSFGQKPNYPTPIDISGKRTNINTDNSENNNIVVLPHKERSFWKVPAAVIILLLLLGLGSYALNNVMGSKSPFSGGAKIAQDAYKWIGDKAQGIISPAPVAEKNEPDSVDKLTQIQKEIVQKLEEERIRNKKIQEEAQKEKEKLAEEATKEKAAYVIVELPDETKEVAEIQEGKVEDGKVVNQTIIQTQSGEAVTVQYELGEGSVTDWHLKDGSVVTAKIVAAAVTEEKLADGSVTLSKIADGEITGGKIKNYTLTGDKIASDGSVVKSISGSNGVKASSNGKGGYTLSLDEENITVGGDISGSLGSMSINSDSHSHTGATISNIDISDDTNLGNGSGIAISGDKVELGSLSVDWSQTGAYDIVLANASSEIKILESSGDSYYGVLEVGDLASSDATYTFSGTSGTVLTSSNYSDTLANVYVDQSGDTMTGSLIFSGVATDITSASNQDIVISPDGTGKVGVGNGSPGYLLDVSGDVNIGDANEYRVGGTQVLSKGNGSLTGNLIVGDGGGSLTHSGGIEGYNNTAAGISALTRITSGLNNTAVGNGALSYDTTGYNNTAVGYHALYNTVNSYSNVGVGSYALNLNTGYENTALGYAALLSNTTGNYNTALGLSAGYSNSTGSGNVFLGYQAGYSETGSNKLYIDNSNTISPLIYGDFSTNALTVYGTLGTTGSLTVNDDDGVSNDANITLGDANEAGQIVFYDGSSNTGTLAIDALGADAVYTFSGATGTILTSANFAGAIADTYVDVTGDTMTGSLIVNDNDGVSSDVNIVLGDANETGQIVFYDGSSNTGTLAMDALGVDAIYTLSGATGTVWTSGNDGSGSGLDADTLDGHDTGYFMAAGTDNWVDEAGDTMSGSLIFSGVATDITSVSNQDIVISPDGTGKVGVLTASPNEALEVTGNIRTSGVYKLGTQQVLSLGNGSLTGNLIVGDGGGSLSHVAGDTGYYNTTLGIGAGSALTTGYNNTLLGMNAGANLLTTTRSTVAVGYGALSWGGGDYSIAVGESTLNNATGSNNVGVGRSAGYYNASGTNNVLIGHQSGLGVAANSYSNNTFIGYQTGYSTTTGGDNFFGGYQSGYLNQTGTGSVAIGYQAGYNNLTGNYNTFLGFYSGYNNLFTSNNTFLGVESGYNNIADDNTFISKAAGRENTSGTANLAIGKDASYYNQTGSYNTTIGTFAGLGATANSYSNNTFVGYSSGYSTTTGSNNVALGYQAGYSNQTGTGNIFIGYQAGYNETGSNMLYIDNSDTTDPLIRGDFFVKTVHINGDLLTWGATLSGNLNVVKADPAIILNTTTATDTDFWLGVTEDAGGDDDDFFQIGDGTTPGTNPFVTINTSGSVGIGTADPGTKLTVNDQSAAAYVRIDSTNGLEKGIQLYSNTTTLDWEIVSTATDRYLSIGETDGANRLVIDRDGKVGIGDATPSYALEVNGDIAVADAEEYFIGSTQVLSKGNGSLTGNLVVGDGGGSFTHAAGDEGYYNTALGIGALSGTTSGSYNSASGYGALNANTSGYNNSAFGAYALLNNTIGYSNNALGAGALISNTEGAGNIAIGDSALYSNINGANNVAIGASALYHTSSGSSNVAIGEGAGYSNTIGTANSALGYEALLNNTEGIYNSAVGAYALFSNTTGDYNVALGYEAGASNQTGNSNVFLGYQAGYSETGSEKLYIDNSNTASPLIYGDFSADALTVNGTLASTGDYTITKGSPAIILNNSTAGDSDFWIGLESGGGVGADDDLITIGSGTVAGSGSIFQIDSSGDIGINQYPGGGNMLSVAGAVGSGGNYTITKADPAIVLNSAVDTDFWLGVTDDAGGDDDDYFQIGDGTTPGTNPFFSISTDGHIGINVTPSTGANIYSSWTHSDDATHYGIYNVLSSTPTLSAQRLTYGIYNDVTMRATEGLNDAYGRGVVNTIGTDGAYTYKELTGAANLASSTSSAASGQDVIYGSTNKAFFNSTAGTVDAAFGAYNVANLQHASAGATITTAYGTQSVAQAVGGDIGTAYGAYNYAVKGGIGNITTAHGSFNYVRNNNTTATGSITTAYAVRAQIDKAGGGSDIGTGYLYYGSIANTSTAYGIYLTGESENYLSGELGIGDATPDFKLDVEGGATGADPTPRIGFNDYYDNAGNPSLSHLQLFTGYGFGVSGGALNYISAQDHVFYDSDDFATPLFMIAQDGDVGIGVASSSMTWDLALGGDTTRGIGMERHTTANTAGNWLRVVAGGATSGATDKNGGALYLDSGTSTGSGSSIIYLRTATAGGAGTADNIVTTKMTIYGSGGVVVGSPTGGDKGAGTINAQGVYDDNTLLTDYVFDKYFDGEVRVEDQPLHGDYNMLTMDQMAQYIETNRHLPTIPGRDEWEANGKFSLGKLVNHLWETAETHGIYVKELNDENKNQELKINALSEEDTRNKIQVTNNIQDTSSNSQRITGLESRVAVLESNNSSNVVIPTETPSDGASGGNPLTKFEKDPLTEFTPSNDGARDDNSTNGWAELQDNIVTIFKELIVTAKTTFGKTVMFLAKVTFGEEAEFLGKASFDKEAEFNDKVALSEDSAGQIEIKAGKIEEEVEFEKAYPETPVITVTPLGEIALDSSFRFTITKKDKTGFTVRISEELDEDMRFDWHAFGTSNSTQSAVSSQQKENVNENNNNSNTDTFENQEPEVTEEPEAQGPELNEISIENGNANGNVNDNDNISEDNNTNGNINTNNNADLNGNTNENSAN